jgi:F0F1-type ATP synthase membrane subunit c/vacuolar-type H+-ATPase subunit K
MQFLGGNRMKAILGAAIACGLCCVTTCLAIGLVCLLWLVF